MTLVAVTTRVEGEKTYVETERYAGLFFLSTIVKYNITIRCICNYKLKNKNILKCKRKL